MWEVSSLWMLLNESVEVKLIMKNIDVKLIINQLETVQKGVF
jgi:hypothetical protein